MIFPVFIRDLSRAPFTSMNPVFFALTVPALEFAIALSLLFDKTRKVALYCSALLMLGFTIYVGYVLGMTSDRPCSCGGIFRDMSWINHMYFNSASTFLAVFGILVMSRSSKRRHDSANDSGKLYSSLNS
ncbi:MauE/DoxX family redox-associated membrane protein [Chitinophaga horti]|uniref:MauE/DoxX family redox-associated membrane protein n=1 Tax=Chitinophaga horti TaxID=2920382 RepID=UPI003D818096